MRQSGSGRLGDHLFDEARLFRDVKVGVLGRLADGTLAEVVDDVIAALERRSEVSLKLTDEEQAQHPSAVGWLMDEQIAAEVEHQLQARDRMASVLYALSTRGRRDRAGREGWADAKAVLAWLTTQYPHLDTTVEARARDQDVQVWVHPGPRAPHPSMIVKRSHTHVLREREQHFDYPRFLRSINNALVGRFEPRENSQRTDLIAEWVLWGVAGQQVVMSGQLANGVLDCLRRVDDIAYLRWNTIMKGCSSVTEFAGEAMALRRYPSPELVLEAATLPARPAALPPSRS